jgi:membrane protein required for colicin V production
MNGFDAAVYLVLIFAVVTGFNTGLLRSSIAIVGYLIAMPVAMTATSGLAPQIGDKFGPAFGSALVQHALLFFGIFLITGTLLGRVGRLAINDATGSQPSLVDRIGGMALSTVRVGLVATTLVLVFDQLVPLGVQPAFLTGSQLRPLFSTAGQMGLRQLPLDLAATIARLKQPQRI